MYKLGVIGVGNMGGAILRGAIEAGEIKPTDIIVYDHNEEKITDLLEMGVTLAKSDKNVAKESEKILIAIKPQNFGTLSNNIKDHLNKGTLIISIAAGITIENLKVFFGKDCDYIRIMSNTPVMVREGMTAISYDEKVKEEDIEFVKNIFQSVGKVIILDEEFIPAFTGAVGSMPAYIFMFVEAAADAAVSHGMKRRDIYNTIAQAVLGSAKLMLESDKHPGELKDQVTSPAGTTIRGVKALEKEGFRNTVIQAIDAGSELEIKIK